MNLINQRGTPDEEEMTIWASRNQESILDIRLKTAILVNTPCVTPCFLLNLLFACTCYYNFVTILINIGNLPYTLKLTGGDLINDFECSLYKFTQCSDFECYYLLTHPPPTDIMETESTAVTQTSGWYSSWIPLGAFHDGITNLQGGVGWHLATLFTSDLMCPYLKRIHILQHFGFYYYFASCIVWYWLLSVGCALCIF